MTCEKYQFPSDWDSLSDVEKSEWMLSERLRRQAMRQNTALAEEEQKEIDRGNRRVDKQQRFPDETIVEEEE